MTLFLGIFLITSYVSCTHTLLTEHYNMWQYKETTGKKLIYPYCTKPFIDFLDSQNMRSWDIFEWGSGCSTIWLANRCKSITSIEDNQEWYNSVIAHLKKARLKNGNIKHRTTEAHQEINHPILGTIQLHNMINGGEGSSYVKAIEEDNKKYDCIFIDGLHRNACAKIALNHIKSGGIIIVNNVNQGTLGIDSTPILELYKNFEHHSFKQPNHLDWRTDYWIIK